MSIPVNTNILASLIGKTACFVSIDSVYLFYSNIKNVLNVTDIGQGRTKANN